VCFGFVKIPCEALCLNYKLMSGCVR
jgi:hypothetical protein